MSFIGGIAGGLLSANAAGNAASAEEQGAKQAQSTIESNQTNANTAQQTALSNVTGAEQPYQTLGSTSANALGTLLSRPFGRLDTLAFRVPAGVSSGWTLHAFHLALQDRRRPLRLRSLKRWRQEDNRPSKRKARNRRPSRPR